MRQKEPEDNIEHVCKDCGLENKGKWANSPDEFFAGKHVKIVFRDEHGGERMWLKVLKPLSNGKLLGRLDNEPVTVRSVKYRDQIVIQKGDIIDVLQGGEGVDQ